MSLEKYRSKRRFGRTPEPRGDEPASAPGRLFVVQKHAARRLHYDFRLELDGVLKSWAIPKGPSLDPYEKRLAVQVEDHPLEYGAFEGVIPDGEYGAGAVLLWDRGTWEMLEPSQDAAQMYREGKLKITLDGEKLRGGWMLVRMNPRPGEKAINWLLIKERDEYARSLAQYDVLEDRPESAASGESIAQVKQARKRTWSSKSGGLVQQPAEAPAKKKPPPKRRKVQIAGAVSGPMPAKLEPQLATVAAQAPEGSRWLHEIKLDGYRVLCQIQNGRVILRTRSQQDWTDRYPELARDAATLNVREAWLDGELVALLPNGASSFPAMQQAMSAGETCKLTYFVFDLLYLDGYDLRGAALEDRKRLLHEILAEHPPCCIHYVDHLDGQGPEFFRQCCQIGLEGTVSKRRDRPYRTGRTPDWLKVKCVQREEFVIGGYTLPSTAQRKGLGALLVGYYSSAGELIYGGKVGTGFSEQVLVDLRRKLDALTQDANPFDLMERERVERGTRWVRPELVAQLEFGSWTSDGLLRYPSFQGLREDIAARTVVRVPPESATWVEGLKQKRSKSKTPAPSAPLPSHPRWQELPTAQLEQLASLQLTHPDRVLYPDQGLTKLGLAIYYAEIAQWILPHVVDRPLSLVRCPEGIDGPHFYQKHAAAGTPPHIERLPIAEKEGRRDFLVIRDLAGLLATVQMGVLELHPWGSRTDRLNCPDQMILDLDPDPELPWQQVVDAARRVHDLLNELGLVSFVKTTGGKGLHLVVPLARRHTWDAVKEFSQLIAQRLAGEEPRRFTASSGKALRRGRIYIDYLRNAMGATAVAAYSTRALPGATVSTPLAWDELSAAIRPDHFRVDNVPSRLASLEEDPWGDFDEVRQTITAAMKRRVAGPL